MSSRLPAWCLPALGGLALTAIFGAHVAHYHPFFADDAFISLRYAQRFLAGEGLTWTAGEAVEGYSNLLWILLVSGLGSLGVDLIDAARALGVGCGAAALVLVWRGQVAGWFAAVALALSGPLAVWSVGGLEQPLVAALLAWALVEGGRACRSPEHPTGRVGLPLAALCLTRPDGPLFVALFAGVLLLSRRSLGSALRLVALPACAVAGQLVFRRLYYADWLPNTAYMKAAWSVDRLSDGLSWVGDGLWTLLPVLSLALISIVAALADATRRRPILLAWAVVLGWTGYIASVGGDIFPAHRHLVPTLVGLAFAGAEGVAWALETASDRRPLALSMMGLLAALVPLQQSAEANARARTERWEWDAVPVARLLRAAFGAQDPLLAVTAAGALPYFSKLRCLDMLGLNDRHIARRPAKAGGYIGHDHADGGYVLDRAPDLMVWGTPKGGSPRHLAGDQVRADPRFAADYRKVRLEGYVPRPQTVTAFVRQDSRIGVTRTAEQVRFPGWLAGGVVKGVLDADERLVGRVPANMAVKTKPIDLPTGQWRVRTDPPELALGVVVTSKDPIGMGRGLVEGPAKVQLHVRTANLVTDLRAIVFERTDEPPTRTARSLGVRPRPPTNQPQSPDRVLHAFDTLDLAGWSLDGIPIALHPVLGQAKIRGRAGGVLNSFIPGHGDRATGRARSPVFRVGPRTALRLRLAGGKVGVGVRLLAAGRVIAQWSGRDDETLRTVTLDLSAHRAQPLQVEVFDDARGRWGHVVVDSVHLVPWRPAQVVSKRMP